MDHMSTARIDDVTFWYETHGDPEGEPVLLLHGGFVDSRMFAPALPVLGDRFSLVTVDRRGQGRTPDPGGPLSYELMARDTIGFLEEVVRRPAHLVGYSDGANVAMLVALRRPDLVGKLVLISGDHHHEGLVPGAMDGFADESVVRALGPRYAEVSPHGEEHFPVVVGKLLRMAAAGPTLTPDDLAALSRRALVMAGDDDAVTLEHTIAQYRAIPDADLAVVPHASHLLVMEKPEQVYGLVADFLAGEPAATRQPIRRAGGGS